MALVYILSDYEEHGPENIVATLDRSRIRDLLKEKWPMPTETDPEAPKPSWRQDGHLELMAEVEIRLKETEAYWEAGRSFDLTYKWGGPQLHIVELK